MRIPRLLFLPVIGLVAFVMLGFALSTLQASSTTSSSSLSFSRTSVGPMRYARGLMPPPGANLTDPSSITFSTQDVQAYVLTHGFTGGAVVPGHTLKILSIQLLTREQADAQDYAGLERNTTLKWVYVVKMQGPFYTTNFKAPVPGPATVPTGFEIFDAHYGDQIGWGS